MHSGEPARRTAFERFAGPDSAEARAPRVEPLGYPGVWPTTPVLLTDRHVLRLRPSPGRRLGQAVVFRADQWPPALDERTADRASLNYVLQRLNRARVDDRFPVLAVGSNAAPAQLWHKFREHGTSPVMPMAVVRVDGLMAGVAADVAGYGSVPATAVFGEDAGDRLFVQWADAQQLAALDETEVGYKRVLLTPSGSPAVTIRVEGSGEVLAGCYAYVDTHGHLIGDGGAPLRLADFDQTELISYLLTRSRALRARYGPTPHAWLQTAAGARESVATLFVEEGWIGRDLAAETIPDTRERPPVRYQHLLPVRWTSPDGNGRRPAAAVAETSGTPIAVPPADQGAAPDDGGVLTCIPSSDGIERHGQSVVRLPLPDWEALIDDAGNTPDHVAIRRLVHQESTPDAGLEVVARCLPGTDPEVEPGRIEVDETLRAALGVEIGEDIAYRTVSAIRRRAVVDWALGEPNLVTCRVQPADFIAAERDVCLLGPLALELLGVESGDEVIIEGCARPGTRDVGRIRIKAFAVTDAIQETRESIHGGDFSNRFPRAQDALGVANDITWIYLDQALRARLNIASRALAVVRVRPSRRQQFRKELREMLLVLAIALVALVEVVPGGLWKVGVVALTAMAAVGAIVFRMRRRLSHSPRSMWSQIDDDVRHVLRRTRRPARPARVVTAEPAPDTATEEARTATVRPELPHQRPGESAGPGHGPGADEQSAGGDDERRDETPADGRRHQITGEQ